MNRDYKFKEGQRVRMRDEFDIWMHGEVTDWARDSFFIQWDKKAEPKEYFQYQFCEIYLITFKEKKHATR